MDRETVLNATPLMDGRITNRRQEIKTKIVSYVLNQRSLTGEVSTFKLQAMIEREIGLNLDESTVRVVMGELEEQGHVSHVKSNTYEIHSSPNVRALSERVDDVWIEYRNRLRENDRDEGIDYQLENHREAFEEVFKRFFESIRGQTESLNDYSGSASIENKLDPIISEVAEDLPLRNPDLLKNEVNNYIKEQTPELLQFIGTIYTGTINYDLLIKENDIDNLDFEDAPPEQKKLFLDTNILIGLLCETDQLHPVASSLCVRAKELDYDLYYLPATSDELQHVIDRAKNTLSGFSESGSDADLDNQFVRDCRNRDHRTKAQYKTELDRWADTLTDEWGIKMWSQTINIDNQDRALIKNWIEQLDEIEGDGDKIKPQIDHDTEIICSTMQTRNQASQNIVVGPFAVTHNDSLLSINKMGKGELWNKGVALHPQDWLDYLIAFTPVEFTDEDRADIAEAVISTATKFDDNINLEVYLEILAIRSDLSDKKESFIKDMVYGTPLENKLTSAIERGDYEELENQGQDLLSELNKRLKENIEQKEQLKKASSKVQEEKQRRKQLESVINEINAVEVNNIQNVSQEMDMSVNQEIINQIEFLEQQLRDTVDTSLEESELPEPPEDYSDPNKVVEWLQQLDKKLSSAENYAERFRHLAPTVTGLLTSFGV